LNTRVEIDHTSAKAGAANTAKANATFFAETM
jgi:hypothetical protein